LVKTTRDGRGELSQSVHSKKFVRPRSTPQVRRTNCISATCSHLESFERAEGSSAEKDQKLRPSVDDERNEHHRTFCICRSVHAVRMVSKALLAASAALWLGGLWSTGYFFGAASRDFAGRLRAMATIGVAIPLACAVVGMLNAAACWIVMIALFTFSLLDRRRRGNASGPQTTVTLGERLAEAIPLIACTAVSWPGLVRPVLDGDSLSYHLPNAASWATAGSIWTASTMYWWYPGGSEMFDAGLLAASGPAALGFAGFMALALLGQRLYQIARHSDIPAWSAAAIAAAVVTVPAIGIQGSTLQNDVWLAAFTLELVWALQNDRRWTIANSWMLSLIKPIGFVVALFAHLAARSKRSTLLLSFAMIAAWSIRIAVLSHSAVTRSALPDANDLFATTILAHGNDGLLTFARALALQGPGMMCLAILSLIGTFSTTNRLLKWTALCAMAFFVVEPYGFTNGTPQLASGQSLRFLFPALVLGTSASFPLLRRAIVPTAVVCLVLSCYQIDAVREIFYTDSATRNMPFVVAGLVAVTYLSARRHWNFPLPILSLALVAFAAFGAGENPARYIADRYAVNGVPSTLFDWMRTTQPKAIVGDRLDVGAVTLVSPRTRPFDSNGSPCSEARRHDALLAVMTSRAINASEQAAMAGLIADCGIIRIRDESGAILQPR
jgi:hypothetical protein